MVSRKVRWREVVFEVSGTVVSNLRFLKEDRSVS